MTEYSQGGVKDLQQLTSGVAHWPAALAVTNYVEMNYRKPSCIVEELLVL